MVPPLVSFFSYEILASVKNRKQEESCIILGLQTPYSLTLHGDIDNSTFLCVSVGLEIGFFNFQVCSDALVISMPELNEQTVKRLAEAIDYKLKAEERRQGVPHGEASSSCTEATYLLQQAIYRQNEVIIDLLKQL